MPLISGIFDEDIISPVISPVVDVIPSFIIALYDLSAFKNDEQSFVALFKNIIKCLFH